MSTSQTSSYGGNTTDPGDNPSQTDSKAGTKTDGAGNTNPSTCGGNGLAEGEGWGQSDKVTAVQRDQDSERGTARLLGVMGVAGTISATTHWFTSNS